MNNPGLLDLTDQVQRRNRLADRATVFAHQLEILLRLTNGLDRLRWNATLWPSFNIVKRWTPAWRHNPDLSNRDDAEDRLDAVDKIRPWIDNDV